MPGTNEAFSRVKIDAQLGDRGWDVLNPNVVRFEYVLPDGTRADYVLCDRHGRAPAVIEAKKAAINPAEAEAQAKAYCLPTFRITLNLLPATDFPLAPAAGHRATLRPLGRETRGAVSLDSLWARKFRRPAGAHRVPSPAACGFRTHKVLAARVVSARGRL